MKKSYILLFIIVICFAIGEVASVGELQGEVIINISCLAFILFIYILSESFKKNSTVFLVISILVIILGCYFKLKGLELIIPLILFKLLNKKINIINFIVLIVPIGMLMSIDNMLFISLYYVIISLYLYTIDERISATEELKKVYKEKRNESYNADKKIRDLERYLDQNNLVVSLKERNFMAQKLHDHLGHRITSSIMQLEVTKETLGRNNELSLEYLESAMENLRTGMDEIRGVLRNVKPKDTMVGIEEIKQKALKFQYDTSIKVNLKVDGDTQKVNLRLWNIVLDNITEALTNVGRYSKASEVSISIIVYNKFFRVEIRDNGIGAKTVVKSLGLQGIEERIEAIGGHVEFYNDNGFVVNMIINLGDK